MVNIWWIGNCNRNIITITDSSKKTIFGRKNFQRIIALTKFDVCCRSSRWTKLNYISTIMQRNTQILATSVMELFCMNMGTNVGRNVMSCDVNVIKLYLLWISFSIRINLCFQALYGIYVTHNQIYVWNGWISKINICHWIFEQAPHRWAPSRFKWAPNSTEIIHVA